MPPPCVVPLFEPSHDGYHLFYKDQGNKHKRIKLLAKHFPGPFLVDVVYEDGTEVRAQDSTDLLRFYIQGQVVQTTTELQPPSSSFECGFRLHHVSRKHNEKHFRLRFRYQDGTHILSLPVEIRSKLKKHKRLRLENGENTAIRPPPKKKVSRRQKVEPPAIQLRKEIAELRKITAHLATQLQQSLYTQERLRMSLQLEWDLSEHNLAHDWFECGLSLTSLCPMPINNNIDMTPLFSPP